jgi:AcrR family transcriptional regulator
MSPSADTEERILAAAAELWHEGGFPAVTTRAVAARAGVNEVTLFRHFASKEGLLKAVVGHAVSGVGANSADAPLTAGGLEAALRGWALAYLRQTMPVGELILLGLVEANAQPEIGAACLEAPLRLRQALTDRLEALADAGELRPGPFAAVAETFYAALFAHVIAARLTDFDADGVATRVACVAAAALRAPADPSTAVSGGAPGVHRA